MRTRIILKLAKIEGKKIARESFEVSNRFEASGDIEDLEKEHNLIWQRTDMLHRKLYPKV